MENINEAVFQWTGAVETKMTDFAKRQKSQAEEISHIKALLEAGRRVESKEQREYREAFGAWLQKPDGNYARLTAARKDVTLGVDAAGGYALPTVVAQAIAMYERTLCPWLDPEVLGVTTVTSGDYREPVSISDAVSSRSTETGTRSDAGTSTFREAVPRWGEYYTHAVASRHAREDIPQLEVYLVREFASQRAALVSNDIIRGTGTNAQLLGITTTTPVTTADSDSPIRAENAVQYVPIGGDTSPIYLRFRDVENLLGAFGEAYLADPSFHIIMRRATWRTMVMGESPKEAPLLMQRNPSLFGIPVKFSAAVDAIGANNFPVLAGAWKAGYTLVDRGPMRVTVDEVTQKGFVVYYGAQRIGGVLRDSNAVKLLKYATT